MDEFKPMNEKVLSINELPSIKNKFTLEGKTAFITGAAGGIGRSSAAAMAELGANVAIMDIAAKEDQLKQCAEEIAQLFGVKVHAMTGDVADEDSVGDMYDEIEEVFGTVDVVHSNAGINLVTDNAGIDLKAWQKMTDVNYTGAMLVARYGAEMMKDHGHGGSVILTASMSGHNINRYWDNSMTQMAYCSGKAGIISLTKAMAVIYADYGIRVNSVSPGYILSGLHDSLPSQFFEFTKETVPLKRYGSLDEIVSVIAMLATDLSTYMLGSDVIVDGGYTVW